MLDAKECWQLFQGDDHFMSLDLPRILYHIQDKYKEYDTVTQNFSLVPQEVTIQQG